MTTLPLAAAADKPVPKSVPCPLEGDLDGATSCPDTSSSIVTAATTTSTRLALLADLLADLPAPERRVVIASLPPADRAAIATLLIEGASA